MYTAPAEKRGDAFGDFDEIGVVGEWEKSYGSWGDGWWEGEDCAGFVAVAGPVYVFAESVEYAANLRDGSEVMLRVSKNGLTPNDGSITFGVYERM